MLRVTFCGINAPQSAMFQADCNSKIQKMMMKPKMTRVRKGSLKMYFCSLTGLSWDGMDAIAKMLPMQIYLFAFNRLS